MVGNFNVVGNVVLGYQKVGNHWPVYWGLDVRADVCRSGMISYCCISWWPQWKRVKGAMITGGRVSESTRNLPTLQLKKSQPVINYSHALKSKMYSNPNLDHKSINRSSCYEYEASVGWFLLFHPPPLFFFKAWFHLIKCCDNWSSRDGHVHT